MNDLRTNNPKFQSKRDSRSILRIKSNVVQVLKNLLRFKSVSGQTDENQGGQRRERQPWELPMFLTFGSVICGAAALGMQEDYGQEICMQEFLTIVLESGRVDYIRIVNGRTVRVFLLSPAAAASETSAKTRQDVGGKKLFFSVSNAEAFERSLQQAQADLGVARRDMVPVYHAHPSSSWIANANTVLPTALMLVAAGLMMRQRPTVGGSSSGGVPSNFFKANRAIAARGPEATAASGAGGERITFDDVAGMREAKMEVLEFVQFLRNPDKFKALGAKIPKVGLAEWVKGDRQGSGGEIFDFEKRGPRGERNGGVGGGVRRAEASREFSRMRAVAGLRPGWLETSPMRDLTDGRRLVAGGGVLSGRGRCCAGRRGPGRRCWPRPWRGRPGCPSSRSPGAIVHAHGRAHAHANTGMRSHARTPAHTCTRTDTRTPSRAHVSHGYS
jgi:hypothetical protein